MRKLLAWCLIMCSLAVALPGWILGSVARGLAVAANLLLDAAEWVEPTGETPSDVLRWEEGARSLWRLIW